MRPRFHLLYLLALICLGLPVAARAQFQDPTPEELKMTSDPKAPGACAVYLYYEEKTDDPVHYHSVYARIKILQEKCKELATVNVPYLRGETKVSDIKARTIHSDGTVIPLAGKPEDLLVTKSGEREFGRRVLNLPSVEVGSILEYRYDIRYDDNHFSSPWWEIQKPFFVHKAHYYFVPFPNFQHPDVGSSRYLVDSKGNVANTLMWRSKLPEGVQMVHDASGRFTIDVADVPPIPEEEYMPPIASTLYRARFYYSSAHSVVDFWEAEAKSWSKDMDHFAEPNKPIQEAVAGIAGQGDAPLDKARKLYKAVQELDNTDFSRRKGAVELKVMGLKPAKRAEDTWAQKSGSKEDIALLYLAMLRASGITAYAMRVVNRNQGVFDVSYLNFDQLDDVIVVASIDGKEIFLDPGEKMCPFQTLHWTHAGTEGVRESAVGRAVGATPLAGYQANNTTRVGDLTVDAHGGVTGSVRILMTGQEALRWRQMALETDADELKKRFDRTLLARTPEGVGAHVDHFLGLDDLNVNLMAVVKVEGTLGTATSKRVILPGFFFESRGSSPFVNEEKRLTPVDMRYAEVVQDTITYHLPEGMTVEGAPQKGTVPWQPNAALGVSVEQSPGQVTVSRTLARGFAELKADKYQDLRAFYEKVAESDRQQLILTTTTEAKAGGKGD